MSKATIEALCNLINMLDDNGCLTDEDRAEYHAIMTEYRTGFGHHTYEGNYSYIAYSILNDHGERVMKYTIYGDSPKAADILLREAAQMICFADCSDEIVESIVVQGWKIEYVGWQPNMLFEFRNQETGEIIWSESFPQWEH